MCVFEKLGVLCPFGTCVDYLLVSLNYLCTHRYIPVCMFVYVPVIMLCSFLPNYLDMHVWISMGVYESSVNRLSHTVCQGSKMGPRLLAYICLYYFKMLRLYLVHVHQADC